MCEMSQKRPLIRSTLVLAFERGKEEKEFKEKESKKKINALRLSSIIFVVALVYVVVVVVNSLEDNWEEFCLLFLCLTSLKKTREATFLCSKKKGENCSENTNNRFNYKKTNYSPQYKSKKEDKKERKWTTRQRQRLTRFPTAFPTWKIRSGNTCSLTRTRRIFSSNWERI